MTDSRRITGVKRGERVQGNIRPDSNDLGLFPSRYDGFTVSVAPTFERFTWIIDRISSFEVDTAFETADIPHPGLDAAGVATGQLFWYKTPVTPGNDHYRFRKILSEHAERFISEHNVLQLRYADPDQARIYKVVEELTPEQRVQAANTDQFSRGHIGWLWRLIEAFRIMPAADDTDDAAWRVRRDELDELMALFCAVCEGSGMAHRTIRNHPHVDWESAGKRLACASRWTAPSNHR